MAEQKLTPLELQQIVPGTAADFRGGINNNNDKIVANVNNVIIPAVEENTLNLLDTNDRIGDWDGTKGLLGTITQRVSSSSKTHVGTETEIETEFTDGRVVDGDLCIVF